MTGDLRARLRPPLLAGALALILFAAGFLGWAALVPISGAVIAAGQVEVEQNRQVVQHPDGGRIAAILVAEGDRVAAGQILLRLDTTNDRAALTLAEGQLARLLAEAARLRAERRAFETLIKEFEGAWPAVLAANESRGAPKVSAR